VTERYVCQVEYNANKDGMSPKGHQTAANLLIS
jgi:hypothetical protein